MEVWDEDDRALFRRDIYDLLQESWVVTDQYDNSERFPIEVEWHALCDDGEHTPILDDNSCYWMPMLRDLILKYELFEDGELEEYRLAKQLELLFDRLTIEQDRRRVALIEKLQSKIDNLTTFEGILLRLYGCYDCDALEIVSRV